MFDFGKLTTLIAPQLNWNVLDFGKARAVVRQSERLESRRKHATSKPCLMRWKTLKPASRVSA